MAVAVSIAATEPLNAKAAANRIFDEIFMRRFPLSSPNHIGEGEISGSIVNER